MSFPHTPMKSNLPGAYMQTPGQSTYQGPMLPNGLGNAQAQPAHSPLTRSLPPLPAPAPKPRPESLSVRQRAAKTVDETLAQEERYPDLDAYLSRTLPS
ncbi:hypothetical protein KEM55_009022 [Ascosphaera atra]|nr:hypothetical protein KEM55_009022 [Ascosphaera atra]